MREIYQDFVTLNFDNFRSHLSKDILMCVKARYDLGCYPGINNTLSYVHLVEANVTELVQLWSMEPVTPVYVDVDARVATTTTIWHLFSFSENANFTMYMHDTMVFNCNNKLVNYTSQGDSGEWAAANIPPVSDYNATRICTGTDSLTGIMQACPVGSQWEQYHTAQECIDFINALPHEVEGAPFGMGNSTGCRDWHLGLARFDPTIHCPHVGPTGGDHCNNNYPPPPPAPSKKRSVV